MHSPKYICQRCGNCIHPRMGELLSDTAARVKWEEKIKSSNPLERLRGKQFIALAGSAEEEYSPELVMKVLEKVQITRAGEMIFNFLDGTEVRTGL